MEQVFNNTTSSAPLSLTCISNNEQTYAEQRTRKYEQLLFEIAISFGLDNSGSRELVQQVCANVYQGKRAGQSGYPLKIWLLKNTVHQCIFKISCQLLSQNAACRKNTMIDHNYCIHPGVLRLQKMPLSYRAVYILSVQFKLNDIEIAEILNLMPYKVKERLHKAFAFIKDH